MESRNAKNNSNPIIKVLAWFDIFRFPLTLTEIVRFGSLFGSIGPTEEVIDFLENDNRIEQASGFYFLSGHRDNIETRRRRFRIAQPKIGRAKKVARLFGLLPWIKMVAVCNSLAVANTEEDSDIDLFIVCQRGTLWRTRLLLAGTLKLLHLRPTPENQKDKLCLSFYVSEDELNLARFSLPDDDPYLRFWLMSLLPLYDSNSTYDTFIEANRWITGQSVEFNSSKLLSGLNKLEALAKKIQIKRFPNKISTIMNTDTRVVVSDSVLKFHVNDRRDLYKNKYLNCLKVLIK